jgi:hypothetical protein
MSYSHYSHYSYSFQCLHYTMITLSLKHHYLELHEAEPQGDVRGTFPQHDVEHSCLLTQMLLCRGRRRDSNTSRCMLSRSAAMNEAIVMSESMQVNLFRLKHSCLVRN